MSTPPVRSPSPTRQLTDADMAGPFPLFVVWEVTMKCDQPCEHCGTRAGKARTAELDTEEAMEVAQGLVRLGTREVTILGGEAYLRDDCLAIVRALVEGGIRVSMQTGGRAFNAERAAAFKEAGLSSLGVSIDGLAKSHDRLRGNLGSWSAAIKALTTARQAGLIITANTQINRLNMGELRELARRLQAEGVQVWQVQLTGPLGRAADQPEWIIEPWQILEVVETLAAIQLEAVKAYEARDYTGLPFNVFANNNVGYFGPHETVLRSRPFGGAAHWAGCNAGIYTLGIESDGTIKACPTLPTAPYAGGNVRTMSLEDAWNHSELIRFARDRTVDELWGFCKTCAYADVCRAGCSWMAHTTLGRRGNNPFCYHRATQLKKRGLRERLLQVERAPGQPYDFGRFAIEEEPWPTDG